MAQEFPTQDPFTEFVFSQRPFGNAKERLTIIPENFFVARQQDNKGPYIKTIRQYYRDYPSLDYPEKNLKAEVVLYSEEQMPANVESIRLLNGKGDFFSVNISPDRKIFTANSKVDEHQFTVKYDLDTGDIIFMSLGEIGQKPTTKTWAELDLISMYRNKEKTASIFDTTPKTAQTLKLPIRFDNTLLFKMVPRELLKDTMTGNLSYDLSWMNGDWQGHMGFDWSVNGKHINIRTSVR